MNPPVPDDGELQTTDKLAGYARFKTAGLPQAQILAVAAIARPGEDQRWLDSPEATRAFLAEQGNLPCFGKPVHGSVGAGAASLMRRDEDGLLVLGDGRRVVLDDLVAEIWRDHARGFLFQELVQPHPDLAALIGPVIGTLRVVTVNSGAGPEVLYAVQKAPAFGAMVDTSSGPLGSYAAVDMASGQMMRLQDRRQMGGTDLATNPVTGAAMIGAVLPDFAEALRLACAAHDCFSEHGILGADVLLSDRGPLIGEVNSNPHHSSYEVAFARGMLNPDLVPKLRAVRARFRAIAPVNSRAPLP